MFPNPISQGLDMASEAQSQGNEIQSKLLQMQKSQQQMDNAKTGYRIELQNSLLSLVDKVSLR